MTCKKLALLTLKYSLSRRVEEEKTIGCLVCCSIVLYMSHYLSTASNMPAY